MLRLSMRKLRRKRKKFRRRRNKLIKKRQKLKMNYSAKKEKKLLYIVWFKEQWLHAKTFNPISTNSLKISKDSKNSFIMPNIKYNWWKDLFLRQEVKLIMKSNCIYKRKWRKLRNNLIKNWRKERILKSPWNSFKLISIKPKEKFLKLKNKDKELSILIMSWNFKIKWLLKTLRKL